MTDIGAIQPDLSIQEAARLLSCSPKHIWTLINERALDKYELGRVNRITYESIQRLRENGHRKPKGTVSA
jgi:excisionase family DNA binding protein